MNFLIYHQVEFNDLFKACATSNVKVNTGDHIGIQENEDKMVQCRT